MFEPTVRRSDIYHNKHALRLLSASAPDRVQPGGHGNRCQAEGTLLSVDSLGADTTCKARGCVAQGCIIQVWGILRGWLIGYGILTRVCCKGFVVADSLVGADRPGKGSVADSLVGADRPGKGSVADSLVGAGRPGSPLDSLLSPPLQHLELKI